MICLITGDYEEAKRWASGQMLEDYEWFFPIDEYDLRQRSNFHVLIVGSAGQNIPPSYFEKILNMAQERGRMGRQ